MRRQTNIHRPAAGQGGSFWGHLLVSLCACVLTVSIVGSAVFLGWRVYDRRQLREKVSAFVESLKDRTPDELADQAQRLKAHPKVARHVLPEIARAIRGAKDEGRQRAAVEISKAFLDDDRIVKTLLELRADPRESVAASAVRVLAEYKPEEKAAGMVGQCVAESLTAAARDQACASLYTLGEPGLREITARLSGLSTGRRVWLTRFVAAHPGDMQMAWLGILAEDSDEQVRGAAVEALEKCRESRQPADGRAESGSSSETAGDGRSAGAAAQRG